MVLEKTLESPLGNKEFKLVHPKGNQPWIFIVRADAEVEAPVLWPVNGKSWLFGKDPDAGKDWRQKQKGVAEDEMVGWHHWLIGHEFERTLGDSEGQRSLVCSNPQIREETWQLGNWTATATSTTDALCWGTGPAWWRGGRDDRVKTDSFQLGRVKRAMNPG